jgi:TetR/AcrR family transcriptional regulator, fatty acid biosynthesis regulator
MTIREDKKQQTRQALLAAALDLSFSKGSFANISLREITHTVHIVPAAFYRHYTELNALGLELADRVAMHVRSVFHQLGKTFLDRPYISPEARLDFLLDNFDQYPEIWHFFIAERLSGNLVLRHAIQREHHFLLQEFTERITDIPYLEDFSRTGLAPSLSSVSLQSAFHWAIQWIELKNQYQDEILLEKQQRLKHSALKQIFFLQLSLISIEKSPV